MRLANPIITIIKGVKKIGVLIMVIVIKPLSLIIQGISLKLKNHYQTIIIINMAKRASIINYHHYIVVIIENGNAPAFVFN